MRFSGRRLVRRLVPCLAAFLVVTALAWEGIPIQVAVWVGHYDLTVNVSTSAGALRWVDAKAFPYEQAALSELADCSQPGGRWIPTEDLSFAGGSLKVSVQTSGHDSPLGRELKRYQYRYLVVFGELADGRQVGKVVEIPDGRMARQISVTLP